jgi:uncharacterized protein (DUF488 family)
MEIYTLGTSNRSLEEFLEILKEYKIEAIVDVRHWPASKLFPHFKKENLEKFLKENGISYFHIEKLGGYREGGYENYMEGKEFKEGLEELIKIAENKRTAIVCAEKFPWKCHRVFISQELERKNFKVIHIIEKGRIWEPKREPRKIKPSCEKRLKKHSNILQNVRIL